METTNEPVRQSPPIEAAENAAEHRAATPPEPNGIEARVRELEGKLHKAEARADEEKERYLRITAEVDTKRKRLADDAASQMARFKLELLGGFLRVIANLERALDAATGDENPTSLREGIEITLKKFYRLIEKHGVQRIEPVGQPFDPQLHEAVEVRHETDRAENEVIEMHRRGYRLGEQLLRPAQVVVNQARRATDSQSISPETKTTDLTTKTKGETT